MAKAEGGRLKLRALTVLILIFCSFVVSSQCAETEKKETRTNFYAQNTKFRGQLASLKKMLNGGTPGIWERLMSNLFKRQRMKKTQIALEDLMKTGIELELAYEEEFKQLRDIEKKVMEAESSKMKLRKEMYQKQAGNPPMEFYRFFLPISSAILITFIVTLLRNFGVYVNI